VQNSVSKDKIQHAVEKLHTLKQEEAELEKLIDLMQSDITQLATDPTYDELCYLTYEDILKLN
jgi:hypothetical protein